MNVVAKKGILNLWYDPVPEAERAKVKANTEFVDMEVDEGQWIKSKLAKVNESDNDSSSEADADKKREQAQLPRDQPPMIKVGG